MDSNRKKVFSDSSKIISKLQLLSRFFEDEIVYRIFVRSQVIHQLFEKNEELDIDKLNLFHIQFTESINELLKRIKKVNEKNVGLIFDEIALNKELIAKMESSLQAEHGYEFAIQKQTLKINQSLEKLYEHLSGHTSEYPMARNTGRFGVLYAADFFHEINKDVSDKLLYYDESKVYRNDFAVVERKLMGLECRHDFRNHFYCGLRSGSVFMEVYRIEAEELHYFIYEPARNLFLLCDPKEISDIDASRNNSRKSRMLQELISKNTRLEQTAAATKTFLPEDIRKLLDEYYEKVSNFDFADFTGDFDVQANILKAMLNTESM